MALKKILGAIVLVALAAGCRQSGTDKGAGPKAPVHSGPILEFHSQGLTRIYADPGSGKLRELSSLPSSLPFRREFARKVASAPQLYVQKKRGQPQPDLSTVLGPMVEDCLDWETFARIEGTPGDWNLVFGALIPDARYGLWKTNLMTAARVLRWGAAMETNWNSLPGFEIKTSPPEGTLRVARARGWVVIGFGAGKLGAFDATLAKLGSAPPVEPMTNWFRATGDLRRLAAWIPSLEPIGKPLFDFSIRGRVTKSDTNLVTEGRFTFDNNLDWKPEAWKFPTSIIEDPLIAFWAAQGFSGWLSDRQVIREIKPDAVPNQIVSWSQEGLPFLMFAASPYTDGQKRVDAVSPRLAEAARKHIAWGNIGKIEWAKRTSNRPPASTNKGPSTLVVTNSVEIVWHGLPIVVPYIWPVQVKEGEFLFAGLFPPVSTQKPAPRELFDEVTRKKNLAYYGWEITGERVSHWRQLFQLHRLLTEEPSPVTAAAGSSWLTNLVTRLGNTGTEVTVTGPREMQFLRNSHLGFTGFELASFFKWYESPAFPLPDEYAPPRPAAPAPSPRAPAGQRLIPPNATTNRNAANRTNPIIRTIPSTNPPSTNTLRPRPK